MKQLYKMLNFHATTWSRFNFYYFLHHKKNIPDLLCKKEPRNAGRKKLNDKKCSEGQRQFHK